VSLSDREIKPRPEKPELAEAVERGEDIASGKGKKGAAAPESLEERLQAAETRAEENHDRLLRVTAELENYKKRMERAMNDFRRFSNESLIKDMLPVVDNLERALQIPEDHEKALRGMREGVEMTLKGLLDSLEKFGVVPIESLDKPFDPNFHEAVMLQEAPGGNADSTVVQELQRGYMMGDRLLRPTMAVVSKKPDSRREIASEEPQDEEKIDVKIQ